MWPIITAGFCTLKISIIFITSDVPVHISTSAIEKETGPQPHYTKVIVTYVITMYSIHIALNR